mgnify:CR=1 FL=1
MKRNKSLSILTGLALAAISFSGCSALQKEVVACPQITALPEAARAFVKTDALAHLVDVRFNGVSASCTKKSNGKIKVDVAAGLKAVRLFTDEGEADVAIISMAMAVLGPDDEAISTEAFGYRIGFGKGAKANYPIAEFDFVVEADQRVVLMLTPTL